MNGSEPQQGRDIGRRAVAPELVELAYDAASESIAWTTFFSELRSSLRGSGWTLVLRCRGATRYVSLDSPSPAFRTVNPGNVFKNGALAQRSFVLAYVGTEFVEEWSQLRLAVARESSGTRGWPPPGIEVFKGRARGLQDDARCVLRAVLPHLQRALTLFFRMEELVRERDTLKTCLDELSDAVFVVDEHAQILHANRVAACYLDGHHGIADDIGRLRATSDADEKAFRTNLKQATSGRKILRGDELASGYTLWVHGVASDRALVFITKARTTRAIAPRTLQDALGITPAQARVTSLFMSGRPLHDIADELEITLDTVRLHLKKVQAKTGARRQASLALEILGVVPRVGEAK